MGCSWPSSFFWSNTPAILSSEAKENIWKYFDYYILINIGDLSIEALIFLNAFLPSSVHSNFTSFFINLSRGFIASAKFGMNRLKNRLTKLICPRKKWRDFLVGGKGTFFMASTLLGSIFTPSFAMMWPSNLPSSTPKIDLAGFKEMPYFRLLSNTCLRWLIWSDIFFHLHRSRWCCPLTHGRQNPWLSKKWHLHLVSRKASLGIQKCPKVWWR